MKLGELVSNETGIPVQSLMLLRHSNDSVRELKRFGASIEEYTAIQPPASKYDPFRGNELGPNPTVVVIAEDRVYGVFGVVGILRTGLSPEIASREYAAFETQHDKTPTLRHYFDLQPLPSSAAGRLVEGWSGGRTRTPVQRPADSFFDQITVDTSSRLLTVESVRSRFLDQIRESERSTDAERMRRLQGANPVAELVAVVSYEYKRNPDVVVEVLRQAKGSCARCNCRAPFDRKLDGTPYLEVHHKIPLAEGGDDTVANAEALCPNCHRKAHYG